jgi:hypothetical protein
MTSGQAHKSGGAAAAPLSSQDQIAPPSPSSPPNELGLGESRQARTRCFGFSLTLIPRRRGTTAPALHIALADQPSAVEVAAI